MNPEEYCPPPLLLSHEAIWAVAIAYLISNVDIVHLVVVVIVDLKTQENPNAKAACVFVLGLTCLLHPIYFLNASGQKVNTLLVID